jgi:hypothetical protein
MTIEIEIQREYYAHEAHCTQTNFWPMNARGLRTCKDCGGVFDVEGKGVATTDVRFDERWVRCTTVNGDGVQCIFGEDHEVRSKVAHKFPKVVV